MTNATLFVARGRTVQLNGAVFKPEELVTLDTADAERLIRAGFLQTQPPNLTPAPMAIPTGFGMQAGTTAQ